MNCHRDFAVRIYAGYQLYDYVTLRERSDRRVSGYNLKQQLRLPRFLRSLAMTSSYQLMLDGALVYYLHLCAHWSPVVYELGALEGQADTAVRDGLPELIGVDDVSA